ncbi:MAG: ATPase, partial [Longimicrobiaceae bacterium]
LPASLDSLRGRRGLQVKAFGAGRVRFGEEEIDLSAVEQLVETAQTRAIARALAWGRGRFLDGRRPVRPALEALLHALGEEGLDAVDERIVGEYAEFRLFELAAALGRLRSLEVSLP